LADSGLTHAWIALPNYDRFLARSGI